MTTPTTTNSLADKVNSALGNLENAGVMVVEALIIADVPWLGFPGIKQVWELFFGWLCGYFIKASQNGATFTIIDLQVGHEIDGISKALADLITAERNGDATEIQKSIQNYANAQSALTHDDGSSS